MQEIFDREHDDLAYPEQTYIASPGDGYGAADHGGKSCRHCGCDMPSESVVCPECGKWWTKSVS